MSRTALAQVQANKQPMSRVNSLKRNWGEDDEQANDLKLSQDSEAIYWSPSPKRPAPVAKATLGARPPPTHDPSLTRLQRIMAGLEESETNMRSVLEESRAFTNSQLSQPRKPSTSSAKMDVETTKTVPAKRKSEVIDLSDSDDENIEPVKKAPKTAASTSRPPRVLPKWDQDHSKMKKPPRMSMGGNNKNDNNPAEPSNKKTETSTSTTASRAPTKVLLSSQQAGVVKLALQGQNIFFTGSAGTGKSVVLRQIISDLKLKYAKSPDAVAVTASTGIAACNVGGITIHSFAGIGLGQGTPAQLATKMKRNQKATTRWARTKVLVIDEVSMMDGELFDKLENIARIIRKNSKPFGGIQLIITGDFFQLPPVSKGAVNFAFNAQTWKTCIDRTINLTKVFRQKDSQLIDMLKEMRFGNISQRTTQLFQSLTRPPSTPEDIEATELFPLRNDVDRANEARLKALPGKERTYTALDGGVAHEQVRNNMLNNFMAPGVVKLKIDAQVMMIKNIDDTLVNGSIGKVEAFMTEDDWEKRNGPLLDGPLKKTKSNIEWPVVKFQLPGGKIREELVRSETFKVEGPTGQVEVSRAQIPLILAWAMSIHKSQGQTIEKVKVDLHKIFEKGQAYVAISRATSIEGLQVLGFSAQKVKAHPAVIEWSKTLESL